MKSAFNWSQMFANVGKRQATLLALSLGLALGFAGGHLLHSEAQTTPRVDSSGRGVEVQVHSSRSSAFEPFWKTMPDPDAMFKNFDVISSDLDRTWAFPLAGGGYIPRVDTTEQEDQIRITAEVPGMDEKNLDVTVTDNSVTIKGDKKDEVTESKSGKSNHSLERFYGSFERTVSLPCRVESGKAEALLKNGLLTITVPKSQVADSQGKKLSIRRE